MRMAGHLNYLIDHCHLALVLVLYLCDAGYLSLLIGRWQRGVRGDVGVVGGEDGVVSGGGSGAGVGDKGAGVVNGGGGGLEGVAEGIGAAQGVIGGGVGVVEMGEGGMVGGIEDTGGSEVGLAAAAAAWLTSAASRARAARVM
ncbi:hypothetical protein AGMMS49531_01040 [Endomicrobiia bacterium]|nr:hypothetical protein AGMMS49531_01040 [Endomicrobiia bacterium]